MKNNRQDKMWECETDFRGFARDVRTGFKELPSQVGASVRETFETIMESVLAPGARSRDGKDEVSHE